MKTISELFMENNTEEFYDNLPAPIKNLLSFVIIVGNGISGTPSKDNSFYWKPYYKEKFFKLIWNTLPQGDGMTEDDTILQVVSKHKSLFAKMKYIIKITPIYTDDRTLGTLHPNLKRWINTHDEVHENINEVIDYYKLNLIISNQ